jgi:cytochrome c-type biogenesis protein
MLESILIAINDMMLESLGIAMLGCFLWGMVSTLLSPCHLASIPLLISYASSQEEIISSRHAIRYALSFSMGLFGAIFAVGGVCALLGRMLGDVPWWVFVSAGLVLVYTGLQKLGQQDACKMQHGWLFRWNLSGYPGAFLLGLLYGILSGVCTFGFLAPILAMITIQQKIMTGLVMAVMFGLGHCTPIIMAGCGFGALQAHSLKHTGLMRKLSSIIIILIGAGFILSVLPW